ncbi:MAG: UxaA family hydrolase, partial [Gemmatimonadaceae bacterium]
MTIGVERAPVPNAPAGSRPAAVRIHPSDDVAVATRALVAGEDIVIAEERVIVRDDIPAGHKIALRTLAAGAEPKKYGFVIGVTTERVERGSWIHSHNLRTHLEGHVEYRYDPVARQAPAMGVMPTFRGYRRANGRVGTRNEIWVLNTVGCVNFVADGVAKMSNERFKGAIDGVHAFGHPFGCSQLGDDLKNTQRILAGLMNHPNAGGVLVLGLGCENNQMESLLAIAGDVDRSRLRFFNSQDVIDEREAGLDAVAELVERMKDDTRVECPASDLVVGNKCGGSDGFSGMTANPLVGRVADRLTALGGSALLTEVPEMFGAEQVLMNRAASREVFGQIVAMVNDFKDYFTRHGQPIYENPSPGNKAGGLTT